MSHKSPSGVSVCKFGGTSLADAAQFRKVRAIVEADPARRYIVPSAPGKRDAQDQKVTDLLYLCHDAAQQRVDFNQTFDLIAQRYRTIASDLRLSVDLNTPLQAIREDLPRRSRDYAASRGEYLSGILLAAWLNVPFIDAAQVIVFTESGELNRPATQAALHDRLLPLTRAVVPGFYGSAPSGRIYTFSRGGSDVSGALVAQGVDAQVYENWTDVSGVLMADPRIVDRPRRIDTLTYRELRELTYMGATVLHDEAIYPCKVGQIAVNIRNTNDPDDPGTLIVPEERADQAVPAGTITGIAGKRDFVVIQIEKSLMNSEVGFGHRVLGVLAMHGVSFEHMPSGIDTMSLVLAASAIKGKEQAIMHDLKTHCQPERLDLQRDIALIATVGRGMAHTPGMAARLFTALARAGVNVRMIDQGSSELNIIVGVDQRDFDTALRAIYAAFVPQA